MALTTNTVFFLINVVVVKKNCMAFWFQLFLFLVDHFRLATIIKGDMAILVKNDHLKQFQTIWGAFIRRVRLLGRIRYVYSWGGPGTPQYS